MFCRQSHFLSFGFFLGGFNPSDLFSVTVLVVYSWKLLHPWTLDLQQLQHDMMKLYQLIL